VEDVSIQDRLFPQLTCFGCGPSNPNGLRLKSYLRDGVITATFRPWAEHDNGVGYLNGGIITTVLDCHSAAAVVSEAHARGWLPLGGAALPFVTAGIDVRFRRPAPLHDPVELRAEITAASEAEMSCSVEMVFDGKQRATATATWKRWRPR
jgi:acyl-coenzyme A thioesterase PaaI-like protein